jgi:hypothetical protein
MKYINGISKFGDIDYPPLPEDMNAYFCHTWAYRLHGFPIAWFEPVLYRPEFKACTAARFIWEVPKIIEARSHEIQRLHGHYHII